MIAPRALQMLREKAAAGDGYVVSIAAGDLRELLRACDARQPLNAYGFRLQAPQHPWNTCTEGEEP